MTVEDMKVGRGGFPWRIRVEQRLVRPRWVSAIVPVLSIVLGLLTGALLIWANGVDPIAAYVAMAKGAFGSKYALGETLVKTIPLILAGLGVSLAFRMQLWNIGAEGQLHMGAIAAGGIALFLPQKFPQIQPWMWLVIITAAGFAAGALWALIPGALKAYLNVNEIITTLMLNYVAILWVDYLVNVPWKDPASLGFPLTAVFPRELWLPRTPGLFFLTPRHRVHLGLLFGIVAAILLYVFVTRSKWGFEVDVIGRNQKAARYAGMRIARNVLIVMAISGGLAGVAGMAEVMGIIHRLQHQISPGYGYTAIIIAWLAKLHPLVLPVVAFLFGALLVAGDQLQISMGLPVAVSFILQGLILFFVLGGEILSYYTLRIERVSS